MRPRDILLVVLPAAALAAGLTSAATATNSPVERELDDVQVYSFDTGSHTARVWIWCTSPGGNGIYMVGDTDQFQVIESDPECAEDGRFD